MHKPRINGTAYDIVSGKIRIGGTAYNLRYGTERVSGSANKISLGTAFANLMRDAVSPAFISSEGRNSNTAGTVSLSIPYSVGFPFYVFSVCDGEFSVNKIASGSSSELLYQSSSSKGNINLTSGVINYSHTDSGRSSSVYGATLIAFTFPNYTASEVDAILSAIVKDSGSGRNMASTEYVSLDNIGPFDTLIATWYHSTGVCFAVSSPIGTVVFSTAGGFPVTNSSLILLQQYGSSGGTSTSAFLSADGTNKTGVYGGSIIKLA